MHTRDDQFAQLLRVFKLLVGRVVCDPRHQINDLISVLLELTLAKLSTSRCELLLHPVKVNNDQSPRVKNKLVELCVSDVLVASNCELNLLEHVVWWHYRQVIWP